MLVESGRFWCKVPNFTMDLIKREFRVRNFGFCDTSPDEFYRFQWPWPGQPTIYVIYRVVIAIYQVLWNALVIIYWDDTRFYRPVDTTAKWPIYLSNWSFFLLTVYFVAAAGAVVTYHLSNNKSKVSSTSPESIPIEPIKTSSPIIPITKHRAEPNLSIGDAPTLPTTGPLPWYFKLTWLLQSVSSSAVLFVAMGYWFFEYDPELEKLQVFTVHVHAIAAILAIVDFVVVAHPFRVLHFIYPMVYFTVYIVFSVVYYHAGGINPYGGKEMYEGLIDWEDGVEDSVSMSMVFIFVLGPVLHAMYFGLYLLRRLVAGEIKLSCQCCRRRDLGEELGTGDKASEGKDAGREEDRKRLDENIENGNTEC